jgi:hypothetical protein
MIELDSTVGAAGAIALSAAALVSVHRVRKRSRAARRAAIRLRELSDFPVGLDVAPLEVVPAQRMDGGSMAFAGVDPESLAPLVLTRPLVAGTTSEAPRPTVKVRRVTPTGKSRTPRAAAPVVHEATASNAPEEKAELLSLIETMQWERALTWVRREVAEGADPAPLAAIAEAAALERLRALPESEAPAALAGYRVLAALCPANDVYAEKVALAQGTLEGRRVALLDRLTRDEDRWEPGTVWFNHPYNPAFDDLRLPIWLYIGRKEDGQTWLRLRTNWLGDTRISVQGIEAVYDRMSESLTEGHYKIDADALGWEWRDEAVSPYQLEVLRSIVAAEAVTLRYKGDPYLVEVELSPEERHAVADIIELYDLLRMDAASAQQALAA